jgi:hypothetical protein
MRIFSTLLNSSDGLKPVRLGKPMLGESNATALKSD